MNAFVQAASSVANQTTTTNGMAALRSSLSACVDLFYKIGSARGQDLTNDFRAAYHENPDVALRILQWSRDVRGGAGERQTFRDLILWLEQHYPSTAEQLLYKIPEIGRFDDLLIFKTARLKDKAFSLYGDFLRQKNLLAGKWAPRLKSANHNLAKEFAAFFGLSEKQYRKQIKALSDTVEQKMCQKNWSEIEFGKLPSLAAARYQKAFARNAAEKYAVYKEALLAGEEKINASAIFPHEIVCQIRRGDGDTEIATKQWDALPDYMTDANILPMVDVSGSMSTQVPGNPRIQCMDVAIALGLYCADKNKGTFKDLYLTFTETPQLKKSSGDIVTKLREMESADWGMSTNIEAAFELVLKTALGNKVPAADMPKYLLILSDMQFNAAVYDSSNPRAMEMIRQQYTDAGYQIPVIVFWNLNAANNNVPVEHNERGSVLVSGFSPSILKAILAADFNRITPENLMLDAVMSDRYALS
jgi:hypothetical protein